MLERDASIPAICFIEGYKTQEYYKVSVLGEKRKDEDALFDRERDEELEGNIRKLQYKRRNCNLNFSIFFATNVLHVYFAEEELGTEYKYGSWELQGIKYRYRIPGWDFVPVLKEANHSQWRKRQSIEYYIAILEAYNLLKDGNNVKSKDIFTSILSFQKWRRVCSHLPCAPWPFRPRSDRNAPNWL